MAKINFLNLAVFYQINYLDSESRDRKGEKLKYSIILSNPPFIPLIKKTTGREVQKFHNIHSNRTLVTMGLALEGKSWGSDQHPTNAYILEHQN